MSWQVLQPQSSGVQAPKVYQHASVTLTDNVGTGVAIFAGEDDGKIFIKN
jgi:hypothetical protein